MVYLTEQVTEKINGIFFVNTLKTGKFKKEKLEFKGNKNRVEDLNPYGCGLNALIKILTYYIGFKTHNYVLFVRDI